VNIKTWKSIDIGGRDHAFLTVIEESSASPDNVASDWPWKRGSLLIIIFFFINKCNFLKFSQIIMMIYYFQTIEFSAGTYLALPEVTRILIFAVLSGVGIFITTLLAINFGEKLAFTVTRYSTRDLPISLTTGWTRNGRLTFSVVRYLHK